jgi:hypothetical protein
MTVFGLQGSFSILQLIPPTYLAIRLAPVHHLVEQRTLDKHLMLISDEFALFVFQLPNVLAPLKQCNFK